MQATRYRVGFVGTKKGMTISQRRMLGQLLPLLNPASFHCGINTLSDEEALHIAFDLIEAQHIDTEVKSNQAMQARDIIRDTHILIAAPKEPAEIIHSSTWSVIRRANKRSDYHILIIRPDGLLKVIYNRKRWVGGTNAIE